MCRLYIYNYTFDLIDLPCSTILYKHYYIVHFFLHQHFYVLEFL